MQNPKESAPGLNANAVAELTISKMLDISRGTFTANYDVKVKHEWNKYKFEGRELRGKTLGVMGFGRIGKRVGELGRAFGMTVVAYDPFLKPEDFEKEHATGMSVDEMLKVADFVSIHVPLTPETKDLFNAKSIAEMKDDAVVLNMSRGGIVNEKDMYEALKAGKIGGYAADVMENELAGSGLTGDDTFASPLFECDNFIVSPHIGAQSVDASRDIGLHIISKVKEALSLYSGIQAYTHIGNPAEIVLQKLHKDRNRMILSPVPVFLFHKKLLEYHWLLQQFRPQHNIRIRRLFPGRLASLRSF